MEIKKVVVKLNIHDDKDKQRAMRAVSSLPGIDSLEADTKECKLTVIGGVDPVAVVGKLKKQWNAQIVTVGPPKEEKKDGDKKDGDKKDGDKKDGDKKDGKDQAPAPKPYYAYPYAYPYPHPHPHHQYRAPVNPVYYCVRSMEDDPNSCAIC